LIPAVLGGVLVEEDEGVLKVNVELEFDPNPPNPPN